MKNIQKMIWLLITVTVLSGVAPVRAAQDAYLTLEGETTGTIEGDVDTEPNAGSIRVHAFEHTVRTPRDSTNGLPTGGPQHTPLTIVKQLDKSSPKLRQVHALNENLIDFTLRFYRQNSESGVNEHYYTITLLNAKIVGIRNWTPNTLDPSSRNYRDMEEVSFTYQKITWTHEPSGVSTEDEWGVQ